MVVFSFPFLYIETNLFIVFLQVSSKVHNQLLQIADERAQSAEQKALQLERQVSCIYVIELAIMC